MVVEPKRVDGPTPNGGAYAILFTHDDGSVEIAEFDAEGGEVFRTYGPPPEKETPFPVKRVKS